MKMALKRQSNIELCRIAAILLVLIVHTTRRSLGNDVSFGILLLSGFSIIGVNVFVLITGYFSARPKKLSLANLLFICFFLDGFKAYHQFIIRAAYRCVIFVLSLKIHMVYTMLSRVIVFCPIS